MSPSPFQDSSDCIACRGLSGVAVMGDKKVQVREAPPGRTAPRVVVRATVVMGDVKIIGDSYAEPARRTLRGWLSRDDRDRRAIE